MSLTVHVTTKCKALLGFYSFLLYSDVALFFWGSTLGSCTRVLRFLSLRGCCSVVLRVVAPRLLALQGRWMRERQKDIVQRRFSST